MDLQELIDSVEDEISIIDSEWRIEYVNRALRARFGEGSKTLIGRRCYEALHGTSQPCTSPWDCPLKHVIETGRISQVVYPASTFGTPKYLKVTLSPLGGGPGKCDAVSEVVRDVTPERDLESQVLRRHHQLLALSKISSTVNEQWDLDAILRIALDIVLEIINGTIAGVMLIDEESDSLSYRMQRGLSAKYADTVRLRLGEGIAGTVAKSGTPILVEDVSVDTRAAHGDLVKMEGLKGFVSVPLKTTDKIVGVMNVASRMPGKFTEDDLNLLTSIGHQIATAVEQARLCERLAMASERYQELLRRALTAQEEERKRIARELHDETSQQLTSLALSLQAVIGLAEIKGVGDAEFMGKLKRAHSNAIYAGSEIVKLMKELRPTLLDELGMAAAIRRYAKDTLEPHGISVTTQMKGAEERFQPEVEVTLFRVAQGAIGNVLKHSEAKNARIVLDCNANECMLQVEDDGKGFDARKLTKVDASGRGAGLFTMKERIKLVGGYCRVESQPGRGTRIKVRVPAGRHKSINEEHKSTHSR